MPPPAVKTIRELIYWEYTKLIAGSAVRDRKNYGFVMYTYQLLRNRQIKPSDIMRENKKLFELGEVCAYCNTTGNLEWEHIIPRVKLILDTFDNQVLACRFCNSKKRGRDPFEWYGLERRYEVPRIVLGKYLKLIYEIHERQDTLDKGDLNRDGKLNVYDLGVILPKEIS